MASLSEVHPGKPRTSSATRSSGRSKAFKRSKRTRVAVKRIIVEAFRKEFPTDTIDVSDGYKDNIHVLVVSRKFDPMTERQKQDLMWTLLKSAGLKQSERDLITLLLPLSPAEIK